MSFAKTYIDELVEIAAQISCEKLELLAEELLRLREGGGRLFFLGVGGSAANCSHAVNDFRKLCRIESYAATDNVSELTARANDEGWERIFRGYLETSGLCERDALFVLSVGGGDLDRNISPNLVRAIDYGLEVGARILGIVGREDGYAAEVSEGVIVIPVCAPERVTPHSEGYQSVLLHLLVSHPLLSLQPAKWESLSP